MKIKIALLVCILSTVFTFTSLNNDKAHADILYKWVEEIAVSSALTPSNPYYYETTTNGARMGGWLQRVTIRGSGHFGTYHIFEGYIYNLSKGPIPYPFKVGDPLTVQELAH